MLIVKNIRVLGKGIETKSLINEHLFTETPLFFSQFNEYSGHSNFINLLVFSPNTDSVFLRTVSLRIVLTRHQKLL